ncbi:MAG TPA: hypothetical protein VGN97_17860 [Mesorhizobium sp.]|nr:hypothetical protein [Mesorhizobium sp.]
MKRALTISALALSLAGLGAAAGQTQDAFAPSADGRNVQEVHQRGDREDGWREGRRGGRHEGRRHGGGRRGGDMMRQLQTFDANGDGAVTQAEIDQFRQGQIMQFDANRDGNLSVEEYQALWLDQMRERMVDAFQEHDDDGNGQVTAEEFNERFTGLVERLDRNGDGQLSPDDRGRGRRGDRERAPAGDAVPPPAPGAEPAPAPEPQRL